MKSTTPPQRLLLITIDQFKEEYIQELHLKNFEKLRAKALRFPNAWVGHFPTINVLSHAVLTTGLLPKNLPFQDHIFKDNSGLLGKRGALYSIENLKRKQLEKLLKNTAESNLHTRLKYGHRGDTFTVSNSSSNAYALGSPYSDLIITLDAPSKSQPLKGWCAPTGVDVPDYFLFPKGGRFYLDCSTPLKGSPFILGEDQSHMGGDRWVTDSVLEIMKQEADWRAIFANFASLDYSLSRVALDDNSTNGYRNVMLNLDLELGKIIQYLEDKNLLKETLIVITSTHGGQQITSNRGVLLNRDLLGKKVGGDLENDSNKTLPEDLKALQKTKILKAVSFDSSLKFFLNTHDTVQLSKLAIQVSELPGVAEIYTRQDMQFIRTFRSKNLTGPELEWAREKHQELISTMTSRNAPDLVAILFPGVGYNTIGDSGSINKNTCQKVPVLLWAPNVDTKENPYPIRVIDINPVVSRIMKLKLPISLDGSKAAIDSSIVDP